MFLLTSDINTDFQKKYIILSIKQSRASEPGQKAMIDGAMSSALENPEGECPARTKKRTLVHLETWVLVQLK